MNILFLSIVDIPEGAMKNPGIYTDLLKEFKAHGHEVYVACGHEKRFGNVKNIVSVDMGIQVLHVPIGNVTKTNYLEKGINTVLLPRRFTKAIEKYYADVRFDLILYATPPVTLCSTIKTLKKKYNAKTYLMLKDMWPEGISSLGVIKKGGIIYRYFEAKEKAMYKVSDYIGCMSEACVRYLHEHHPQLDKKRIMVCPNSLAPNDISLTFGEKLKVRKEYSLPQDKVIIVYGGNLGRAQGINFLIDNLRKNTLNDKIHFVIIGSGLEYPKIKAYIDSEKPKNVSLINRLPREDYDRAMAACDVGMILLNYRLTVPNIPSRILDYMQAKLPILACVDSVTDIGRIVEEGNFGWSCYSNDSERFNDLLTALWNERENLFIKGDNGYKYFLKHYSIDRTYWVILNAFTNI